MEKSGKIIGRNAPWKRRKRKIRRNHNILISFLSFLSLLALRYAARMWEKGRKHNEKELKKQ